MLEARRRHRSPAAAHARAEARTRAALARDLAALDSLEGRVGTPRGHAEALIADTARVACDFYRRHDYHTLPRPAP